MSNEHLIDPTVDQNELEYTEAIRYLDAMELWEAEEAAREAARATREAKYQEHLDRLEAAEEAAKERRKAIQVLLANVSGSIAKALAAHEWIYPLDVGPSVQVTVDGFAPLASFYEGPLDDPARFVAWCVNRITAPEKVDILKKQFSLAVLKGVWGVLRNNIDLAQGRPLDKEARDIAARAWRQFYLLEKADTITDDKGLAKYFREMGYWQARAWKTDQLRFEEDHLSLDDEEQFRSYGVDDNVGDGRPTDHSVHPFYPGPNDGLDGLPPDEPKPKARTKKPKKADAKPKRKYTKRPKPKPVLSTYTGVVAFPGVTRAAGSSGSLRAA